MDKFKNRRSAVALHLTAMSLRFARIERNQKLSPNSLRVKALEAGTVSNAFLECEEFEHQVYECESKATWRA